MALLDSSQTIVASYRYDEFGKLLKKAAIVDQPFMFSTKQYDESTGLSYYGYRFYNPVIGKWLTRDPLGEAGGINLYQMVGNNPVNLVDPYGLGWKEKAFTAMTSFWKIFGPSVLYVDDMIIKPIPFVGSVFSFLAYPTDTVVSQEEEMQMIEEWNRQRKEGGKCAPPPPPVGPGPEGPRR